MNPDTKIMNETKNTLLKFGNKYLTDKGNLKTFNLVNDLDNFDKELMTSLFQNKTIYDNYVEEINGTDVFKVNQFTEMFQYKEFWEDSYTKYSNNIGLTSDNKFISDNADVVLDFPFKDCILEAGMTKEDSKDNDEAFLNQVIAKPEIDELLEPKIFKNTYIYDNKGQKEISDFNEKDNLVIKGNNLIALYSIKKRFSGKVKLIYMDPPYNTDQDDFPYNDSFNHSAWLTFMKNRLEVARDLLRDDGHIIIQTDDGEQAYLKVLMDSIFGRQNYVNTVSVLMKNIAGASGGGEDKRLKKNIEFLTIYCKDSNKSSTFNNIFKYIEVGDLVKEMKEQGKSWKYTSVLVDSGKPVYIGSTKDGSGKEIKLFKRVDFKIKSVSKIMKEEGLTESEVYVKYGDKIFQTAMPQSSIRPTVMEKYNEITKEKNDLISIQYVPKSGRHKGEVYEQFYKGDTFRLLAWLHDVSKEIDGKLYKSQKLGTFWDYVSSTKNVNKDGDVSFSNGKKPELLLSNIISMATNEEDLVLDPFMGSATTQAVSLKLNRQFIGIEQLDYIDSLSKQRLINVINGDQSGISKDVNWHGGGSFVYTELMEKSYKYIKYLQNSTNDNDLNKFYESAKNIDDINFNVDLDKFNIIKDSLIFDDKKSMLIQMIDKNQLYYNYSNIEDENIKSHLSKSDYEFNKSFYK